MLSLETGKLCFAPIDARSSTRADRHILRRAASAQTPPPEPSVRGLHKAPAFQEKFEIWQLYCIEILYKMHFRPSWMRIALSIDNSEQEKIAKWRASAQGNGGWGSSGELTGLWGSKQLSQTRQEHHPCQFQPMPTDHGCSRLPIASVNPKCGPVASWRVKVCRLIRS